MIQRKRSIYFVGIKGVAMTALALYCQKKGDTVAGCDTEEYFPTSDSLSHANIPIDEGFHPDILPKKCDLVVYTGAHNGEENPVVVAAKMRHIETLPHGRALGMEMEGKRQIVAAGSHGKTTMSAMIATILSVAKKDPSYAVGCGAITRFGEPGHCGAGEWFVAEGDEYVTDPGHDKTPRFLWTHPEILVVSNIDFDHPDVYASIDAVTEAFLQLMRNQQGIGVTIVNVDDENSRPLLRAPNVLTYGQSPRADVRIDTIHTGPGHTFFQLSLRGMPIGEYMLAVPGIHNVLNATAAAAACYSAGLSWNMIRDGLAHFHGTKRRFEQFASIGSVEYLDDYAHHPHEIEATLQATRSWYPKKRIVAVFQPHTYSRTKALLGEFALAFGRADTVIITDIYASARESETLGMTAQKLVDRMRQKHKHVIFAPDRFAVSREIRSMMLSDAVVIFMGAGDIYTWEKEVIHGYDGAMETT